MFDETQRTVTTWGERTFGPCSALEVAARMGLEVVELIEQCASGTDDDELHTLLAEQKRLARAINGRVNTLVERGALVEPLSLAKAIEECADVDIMNLQIMDKLGGNMQVARNRKMRVNRNRIWQKEADGTMQHVEDRGD